MNMNNEPLNLENRLRVSAQGDLPRLAEKPARPRERRDYVAWTIFMVIAGILIAIAISSFTGCAEANLLFAAKRSDTFPGGFKSSSTGTVGVPTSSTFFQQTSDTVTVWRSSSGITAEARALGDDLLQPIGLGLASFIRDRGADDKFWAKAEELAMQYMIAQGSGGATTALPLATHGASTPQAKTGAMDPALRQTIYELLKANNCPFADQVLSGDLPLDALIAALIGMEKIGAKTQ